MTGSASRIRGRASGAVRSQAGAQERDDTIMPNTDFTRDRSMIRTSAIVLLSIVSVCGLGCAMCCGPDMYTYPTYGGRVQRSDPEYGRVGSIYSDHTPIGLASSSNQIPSIVAPSTKTLEPEPSEELEKPEPKPQLKPAPNDARRQRSPQGWR